VLGAVEGLIAELRQIGLPIRVSEDIDAVAALRHVDLGQRSELKASLGACLVKDAQHLGAFETVFDLYFPVGGPPGGSPGPAAGGPDAAAGPGGPEGGRPEGGRPGDGGAGGSLGTLDDATITQLLIRALRSGDRYLARAIAGLMVDRHAQIVPGRPVAGTYYLLRTMRAVNPDALVTALAADPGGGPPSGLAARLRLEQSQAQVEQFRLEVEAEIRRRLTADRGAAAVARTLRSPLPEDVSFLTASQDEIATLRHTIEPLARTLAGRLARKRRHGRQGHLDFRRTMRGAMSCGGVAVTPVFRAARPAKPKLIVLADISGSVATFAAFTLHLMSALRQQFASVRSFVFVDGIDEVTGILATSATIAEAAHWINAGGSGVWLDGRSDYGHALSAFWDGWGSQISSRTTVLVLGDARTNYHAPRDDVLAAIGRRAGQLYWLNPEPASAWDSGDSVVGRYAPSCDAVIECRNVRQLRAFVESLA
jgi:uncharacterized protein with von Willebrand factor type A (vWA) domain